MRRVGEKQIRGQFRKAQDVAAKATATVRSARPETTATSYGTAVDDEEATDDHFYSESACERADRPDLTEARFAQGEGDLTAVLTAEAFFPKQCLH